jgi:hypothetical protein
MNPLKDLLNKMLTNEQKTELKAQLVKFNVTPVQNAAPVAPVAAAPASTPPAEPSSTGGTLQSGEAVKWDTPTLTTGSKVVVVTPDGELPLPDGEYTLDNGSTFEIMNGAVTEVAPGGEVEVPSEMPMAAADPNDARITALEAQVAQLTEMCNTLKTNHSAQFSDVTKDVDNMKEFFNSLLDTPTAAPIESQIDKTRTKNQIKINRINNLF